MMDINKWVMGVFGIIITLAIIAAMWYIVGCAGGIMATSNTPYTGFSIQINETFTENYSVSNSADLVTSIFLPNAAGSPSVAGYMILSTSIPGSYEMTIITNGRGQVVKAEWMETYACNKTVGDKFDRHEETTRCKYWVGSTQYRCTSNDDSDCHLTMTQRDRQYPELQIYILGHGSGTISIRRVA